MPRTQIGYGRTQYGYAQSAVYAHGGMRRRKREGAGLFEGSGLNRPKIRPNLEPELFRSGRDVGAL
jgi:hypothetical protein